MSVRTTASGPGRRRTPRAQARGESRRRRDPGARQDLVLLRGPPARAGPSYTPRGMQTCGLRWNYHKSTSTAGGLPHGVAPRITVSGRDPVPHGYAAARSVERVAHRLPRSSSRSPRSLSSRVSRIAETCAPTVAGAIRVLLISSRPPRPAVAPVSPPRSGRHRLGHRRPPRQSARPWDGTVPARRRRLPARPRRPAGPRRGGGHRTHQPQGTDHSSVRPATVVPPCSASELLAVLAAAFQACSSRPSTLTSVGLATLVDDRDRAGGRRRRRDAARTRPAKLAAGRRAGAPRARPARRVAHRRAGAARGRRGRGGGRGCGSAFATMTLAGAVAVPGLDAMVATGASFLVGGLLLAVPAAALGGPVLPGDARRRRFARPVRGAAHRAGLHGLLPRAGGGRVAGNRVRCSPSWSR